MSIVIPVYNAESYLRDALDSCLAQTYERIEVVVVDDGSTDSTLLVAKAFVESNPNLPVRLLSHPNYANLGVGAARLLGAKEAKGSFVCFLDADDCFLPQKIERQISCFRNNKSIVLCHTAIQVFGETNNPVSHEKHFSCSPSEPYQFARCEKFLFRLHVLTSSVMIQVTALEGLRYPSRMPNHSEDWLLFVLISGKGDFIQLPERLTLYRMGRKSLSSVSRDSELSRIHSRIDFLVLISLCHSPSFLSFRAVFLLLRTLVGLFAYYSRQVSQIYL